MKRNESDALISQKQEEFHLTTFESSKSSICQRVMKNKPVCPPHSGTETPVAPVEQCIVSMMEQLSKM